MIRKWSIIPKLLIIVFIIITSGSYVLAADPPDAPAAINTFITVEHKVKSDRFGDYAAIEAKLIGEDGVPIGNRSITFFEIEDYFGLNSVNMGTAVTSAVGIASMRYETLRKGEHQIEAIFPGDDDYMASRVISTINVSNVQEVEQMVNGLQPVHNAGLMVVGVIVICVWILLLLVLYKVFFSIRRSGDLPA